MSTRHDAEEDARKIAVLMEAIHHAWISAGYEGQPAIILVACEESGTRMASTIEDPLEFLRRFVERAPDTEHVAVVEDGRVSDIVDVRKRGLLS